MSDATPTEGIALEYAVAPEFYVRVNIAKNSKGYTHETTVSMRWSGDWEEVPVDGESYLTPFVLGNLHRMADESARKEIKRRESLDEVAS
jgi:hypothetical protein